MGPADEDIASCIQTHHFLSHITPVHDRMAECGKASAAIEHQLPVVTREGAISSPRLPLHYCNQITITASSRRRCCQALPYHFSIWIILHNLSFMFYYILHWFIASCVVQARGRQDRSLKFQIKKVRINMIRSQDHNCHYEVIGHKPSCTESNC